MAVRRPQQSPANSGPGQDWAGLRLARFANILWFVLKPQDAVVLLKLVVAGEGWTYPSLAESLGMSASEVHAAVGRAKRGGL